MHPLCLPAYLPAYLLAVCIYTHACIHVTYRLEAEPNVIYINPRREEMPDTTWLDCSRQSA
jgi:hypothetical protein